MTEILSSRGDMEAEIADLKRLLREARKLLKQLARNDPSLEGKIADLIQRIGWEIG